MIDVDVVVIGGGLQGLLVLDVLAQSGRSCVLISPTDVGGGQTLHSHGVLNAGFGMAGPGPLQLLQQVVVPDLRRRGIPTYGEWYGVMPPGMPVDDDISPPPGLERFGGQLRRLPEVNFGKMPLVQTLVAGLASRILHGSVASLTRAASGEVTAVEVGRGSGSETLVFAPHAIVVAAGTGTKALLRRFGADQTQLEPIKHRRVHVLCVRGPSSLLPPLNVFWMAGLLFVAAHEDGERTWYATPMDFGAPHIEEVPGDAAAEVDQGIVASGWDQLFTLYPPLRATPGLRFTSYAGYRQDIGDGPGVPMCARISATPNVVAALPSGLLNAWPIARDAVEMATEALDASRPQPAIPTEGPGAKVGLPSEDREGVVWTSTPTTA
jgi:glycine/D-amino acid oxidase-like deaminating enzyme